MEIWKEIKEYEGKYLVSNMGNVYSRESYVVAWGKSYRKMQRPLKIINNGKGYMYVTISVNRKRKNHYVHRLVAEAFIGNPLGKKLVNHKNGIKSDNRVENLEWCTSFENQRHAVLTGLRKVGGDTHMAVKIINLNTNEVFGCIKDGSKKLGINYGTLKDALLRKGHFRNYIKRYNHTNPEKQPVKQANLF